MNKLDAPDAYLLRSLLMESLTKLPAHVQGWVALAFDGAVEKYNAVQKAPSLARKCNKCGKRTLRGVYRNGTKRWYCKPCDELIQTNH